MDNKTIRLTIPHQLTQSEAKARIEKGIADARATYAGKFTNVDQRWTDNRMDFHLNTMGQQISGRVDVQPQQVHLEVDLPWMLAVLAGGFTKRVEQEGKRLLEDKR